MIRESNRSAGGCGMKRNSTPFHAEQYGRWESWRGSSPHFEVAPFTKIAQIDWLSLIAGNDILIMRRGARK